MLDANVCIHSFIFRLFKKSDCDPPADAVRYLACICIGKSRLPDIFVESLFESNHLRLAFACCT